MRQCCFGARVSTRTANERERGKARAAAAVRYERLRPRERRTVPKRHATHSCDQRIGPHRRRRRLAVDLEDSIRAFARRHSHRPGGGQLSLSHCDVHRYFCRFVGVDLVVQALTSWSNVYARFWSVRLARLVSEPTLPARKGETITGMVAHHVKIAADVGSTACAPHVNAHARPPDDRQLHRTVRSPNGYSRADDFAPRRAEPSRALVFRDAFDARYARTWRWCGRVGAALRNLGRQRLRILQPVCPPAGGACNRGLFRGHRAGDSASQGDAL